MIAKLAHGFANDLLSTLCLASNTRLIIVPCDESNNMWFNRATQDNVNTLKERDCLFIGPGEGSQACGEFGLGRMLEKLEIVDSLSKVFIKPYLRNQNMLITAGPTQVLNPVRYLSNRSWVRWDLLWPRLP